MPHRVFEPYPMSHRHYERRPSPPHAPPIATISSTNSPTPSVSSLDRSSVSTPPIRHPSPHSHTASSYASHPHPYYSQPPPPSVNHHSHRGYDMHEGSPYAMPHTLAPHNMAGAAGMGMPGMTSGREPYGVAMPMSYAGGPMHSNVPVVYTEDAATKLSDRVRRRCFNCCTTDTSTWRRSNLSPGKVLCNKCGLFERTHSRPRPEQFPHKRGPLASSALHSRSAAGVHTQPSPHMQHAPPPGPGSPPSTNTLPPISHYPYSHPQHPSLTSLNSVAPPPSSDGSHHVQRRDDDYKRPIWQDRVSPPISKRSPPSGRDSPAPPPLSSGSAASLKGSRSRHDLEPKLEA